MNVWTAVLSFAFCELLQQMEASLLNCIPRKTVKHQSDSKEFGKSGFSNFSTLLVNKETDTLFIGAKEAVFAVDMNDITREVYSVYWFATEDRQLECIHRGKDAIQCRNYILLLHKINDTTLYVCGTNAFHPACDSLVINNIEMHLEGSNKESRGKCPFDPTLKYSSVFVDGALYSATYNNFLGTEPIIYRGLENHLRTEFKTSWLNEPRFIHMDFIQESKENADGDDDKIYVFFTETAIEFEFYEKPLVSRIARVCKGDLGGKRLLQKRWTSFLKASLICSLPESDFHFNIVQDVFLLKTGNWRETVFYGIFMQQWGKLDTTAVCAYSMKTVQDVFSKGKYKGLITMENSHVKWVMYRGEVPVPRPGACIDNFARSIGYNTSLDLPDKTLQFVRDHPLLDSALHPIGGTPVLLKRGSIYTKIVVDRIIGLDKRAYDVLFLTTDNGYLHKALNCDGDMFIVEELQLFQTPESVQSLKLSAEKGVLYLASSSRVVQVPIAVCGRYQHCLDCILSRDPYCAWSQNQNQCVSAVDYTNHSEVLIQNIKSGDVSECPEVDMPIQNVVVAAGHSSQLRCSPLSNLASTLWLFNGKHLPAEETKYLLYHQGLLVFNITEADTGRYDCQSVEKVGGRELSITVESYVLNLWSESLMSLVKGSSGWPQAETAPPSFKSGSSNYRDPAHWGTQNEKLLSKIFISLFAFLFFSLLSWNFVKGLVCLRSGIQEKSTNTIKIDSLGDPPLETEEPGPRKQVTLTIKSSSSLLPLVVSSSEGTSKNAGASNSRAVKCPPCCPTALQTTLVKECSKV
ncbi:semaphorin-4E-like [Trichosurus vulpecula]|uniref:semaphorin-4E-like n=1 Tax=Trichosurus vulpecula TaxID=9337 RepID=UPI00186ABC13|nr:semaphorin-4E-like [Trichosurus vulpecula]